MKRVLIGAIAVMLAGACSKSSVVEHPDPVAIAFENPFVGNSTKAEDLTKDNLADFGVWGYMEKLSGVVFSNEKVSRFAAGSDVQWRYNNTQYWVPDKSFHFTAVAPAAQAQHYVASAVDGGTLVFDNKAANADVDLLQAYASKITGALSVDPGAVEFTFVHLLSRIIFSFTNALPADIAQIAVTGVQITDAYGKGVATFEGGELDNWSVDPQDKNLTIHFGDMVAGDAVNGRIAIGKKGVTAHKYCIPAGENFKVLFTVTLYQGTVKVGEKTHIAAVEGMEFQPGHSYEFKATLTEENVIDDLHPIKFSVKEFDEWTEGGDKDIN